MHKSVLLQEVIDYLNPHPGEFIVDGTVNGGGHANEILKKISPGGKFLGIDWDESLIEKLNHSEIKNHSAEVILISGNYCNLKNILIEKKLGRVDGLLLDLGFSSEQIENSKKGFSFDQDEPLLMTYSKEEKPVAEIIRELSEKDLANIIFNLSGERHSRVIAKAIKIASKKKRIISSLELANVVRSCLPKSYERGKGRGKSRIDPATRTFQALRIYANHELENLEKILLSLPEVIASNGRVVILSFHSLEDALVKKYFQKIESDKKGRILTKKPITATSSEENNNPRSRSAKLRAIEIN